MGLDSMYSIDQSGVRSIRSIDLSEIRGLDRSRSDRIALSNVGPITRGCHVMVHVGGRVDVTHDAARILRTIARRCPLIIVASTDAADHAWTRAIETGDPLA